MSSSDLEQNIAAWTRTNAQYTDRAAAGSWARDEISWGIWHTPERDLGVLGEIAGLDVVELGCGTAYFSAWLARRGARVVGVDPTPAQLATARRMQGETGIEFPLVQAPAEEVPLPDESFDLVFSEYGASIWADPYRWIPEASRLLRPRGRLVFLRNSILVMLCMPYEGTAGETLLRPQRDMCRMEWEDTREVEFHLPHGAMIDLLRANRFEIERLVELYATEGAEDHGYYQYVTTEWASRWPNEEIWVARKQ
jgi:SAM-dependent methyltransferase